ncbi:uncharacterized protein LOC114520099 [Dendronephthya gigantea]|uniref:uncharacterized protein LOC114520099 n=1 Tax=Dendronephthya gigantea TaxID=151771 RepID=UPI001069A19D|nr:uncharacterized protein LOC114520099 [Dendronephthya gigantea]
MERINDDDVQREQAESGGSEDSRIEEENLLNVDPEEHLKEDWESGRSPVGSKSEETPSERAEKIEDVERKFTQSKEAYSNMCRMWKRGRRNAVTLLRKFADAIQKDEENSRIAKLAGASSSIVGGILAIGGAVAAFFTYGTSLAVTSFGTGLAAAGSTTLAGAEIVNHVLRSRNLGNVNEALKRDGELTENLRKQANEVRQIEDELEKLRKKSLTKPCISIATTVCSTVSTAYQVGKTVGGKLAEPVLFKTFSKMSKRLHVFGIVFNLVTIPLDVHTLIKTSVDVRNTSIVEIVKVIREKAQELEDEIWQFPDDLE